MGTITVDPSLQAAFNKLGSTTEGAYLIGGLQASSQNTTISASNDRNSGTAGNTDPTTGNVDINVALAGSIDKQVIDLAHELSHSLDVANGDAANFRSDTFDVPNTDHQAVANVGEALAYEAQMTVAHEANIDVSQGNWPDWTSSDLKDAGGFQSFYDSISGLIVSALDSGSSSYSDLGKSGSSSNSDAGKADTYQPVYSDE